MNPNSLEKILREKIATEKPRPGFETRIQAMAREPYTADENHRFRWIAGVSVAAVALLVTFPRTPHSPQPELPGKLVEITPSPTTESALVVASDSVKEPVSREIEGIKSDARRAFDFLSNAVPSMTKAK